MKPLCSNRFPLFGLLKSGTNVAGRGSSRRLTLLAVPALIAGLLSTPSSARASGYTFSVRGSGIAASGTFQVSNNGPFGAYTITSINGTFSDANDHFAGAITGLNSAPAPVTDTVDTYFSAPAFTSSGFSYDNLFWPGGNSPAVCVDAPVFFGGDFDIYGLSFNVAGGYTVDLWSNGPSLGGYQLNDSLNGTPFLPSNLDGLAYPVNFTATPEPGTWLLLGTGLLGLMSVIRLRPGEVWQPR